MVHLDSNIVIFTEVQLISTNTAYRSKDSDGIFTEIELKWHTIWWNTVEIVKITLKLWKMTKNCYIFFTMSEGCMNFVKKSPKKNKQKISWKWSTF